mmetsp:Transcript_20377/g.48301  ORF Transcript_20377/g.48301 Transcript_20377/m.48301 type:complete len:275 (-) Transcript_20377:1834-2658(-)
MVSISLSGTLFVSPTPERPVFLISYQRSLPFCARPTTSLTAPSSCIISSSSLVMASVLSLEISLSRPSRKRCWMYWIGLEVRCSSRWCIDCCATYERRRLWCFQCSPVPSSASRSPMSSCRKVDLPEPLPPTMTVREPSVSEAETDSRMNLSPLGYLKETSLSVMMGLRNVRMPSGLPGSGMRKARIRPASIISSTCARVDMPCMSTLESLDLPDLPLLDEPDLTLRLSMSSASSPASLSVASDLAAPMGAPSLRGRPAAISGLSAWNWLKVIG